MSSVSFNVEGLPPRKGGANSMWGKKNEDVLRLIKLRNKAVKAMGGGKPFAHEISLHLDVRVKDAKAGDLDTFVAGVCDGLQAAPRNMSHEHLHPQLNLRDDKGFPPAVAIVNDVEVTSICASKVSIGASAQEG